MITVDMITKEATEAAIEVKAEDQANNEIKSDAQLASFASLVAARVYQGNSARTLFILTFVEVYQSL